MPPQFCSFFFGVFCVKSSNSFGAPPSMNNAIFISVKYVFFEVVVGARWLKSRPNAVGLLPTTTSIFYHKHNNPCHTHRDFEMLMLVRSVHGALLANQVWVVVLEIKKNCSKLKQTLANFSKLWQTTADSGKV